MYIMGKSVYIPFDLSKVTDNSAEWIIPNGFFNENNVTSFSVASFGNLKRIEIGNDCFGNVRVFSLIGLIG